MVVVSTAGSCKSFRKHVAPKTILCQKATPITTVQLAHFCYCHKHSLQISARDKFYNTAIQTFQVTLSFSTNAGPRLGWLRHADADCPLCQEATRPSFLSTSAHLCTPVITFLPFLDFCTLWLLQDPMRPSRQVAKAPPHEGRIPANACSSHRKSRLYSTAWGTTQPELSQHELSLRHKAWRTKSSQTMVPHRRRTSGTPHRQSLNYQPLQQSKTKDACFQ